MTPYPEYMGTASITKAPSRRAWMPPWLRPPVFEDEAKAHEAFLLHVVLWALVLMPFPYVLGVLVRTPELAPRALRQAIAGEAANLALLTLLRRGHVRVASILEVCALFIFMTVSAATDAGLRGQAYEMGYPLVIVVAGVLLGVRGAAMTTAAALLAGFSMLVADLPRTPSLTPQVTWIVSAVVFPVIATIQYLSERTVRRALRQATASLADAHRAEEAVRDSERRFRTLADASFEGIMIHEGGIIREANRRFAEAFGYADPGELIGKDRFRTLLSQESITLLDKNAAAEAHGGVEVVGVRRDGSTFPGETQCREIEYEGRVLRVVTLRDITERKRAESDRAKLEEQLARALRLESVGRLAGGVAHDFNNLLTCVMFNTSIVLRRLPRGDPSWAVLAEVVQASEKAAQLTRQLLEIGRQEIARPVRLNPNDAIEAIQAMLARMVGEKVRLEAVLASPLPAVVIDPGQLERILVNLCVNARDAMPDGGQIEVRTEQARLTEEEARAFVDASPGEFVRISVSDTGTGMPKDVLDRIFEPFFTTKEPGRGTGLGLASVHGIVKQNRGFLQVDSEVGVGTRFRIYLQRAVD
jgi:PAS domain S-box-containing protein